ncbi:TPA: autotransporter assembly complex protein TamB [Photobacterium damselae]
MIWVKRISLAVLAILLVLVITLATLLFTPAGVKVALWGAQKALPALKIESSDGGFFDGLILNNVQYDDGNMSLLAKKISLNLDDGCLLTPEVCVKELGVDGVTFAMPELPPPSTEPEQPSEPVTEISMPLPIHIENVHLNDIKLDILGNKVGWKSFTTAAELAGSKVTLKPTDWQDIDLTLAPAKPQSKSSSKAKSSAPAKAEPIVLPDVVLPMSFDVERFTVKNFELHGETPQKVSLLELIAKAEKSNINISKLELIAPQASVNAKADVTLTGDYPLELDANAKVAMKPLQGHKLSVKASGSLAKLSLDANLKGKLDALVKGQLSPLDPNLPFDVKVSSNHIQWPIDTKAEYNVNKTNIKAKGSLKGFSFSGKTDVNGTTIPTVNVDLNGKGDLNQVDLSALTIKTLGGVVSGNAKASWKNTVKWQGAIALDSIQPGKQWPEADGNISGKLETSGGLTAKGGWFVKLPLLDIHGSIMKQPFTLAGSANAEDLSGKGDLNVVTDGLTLKHGINGLTAKGSLGKDWNMIAQVNAPDLSRSLAGLRGRVMGDVKLTGKMAEPNVMIDLEGNGLGWQKMASLQSFAIKGQIKPMPELQGDLSITAANGKYDTMSLKDLKVLFNGSEKQHTLTLNLDAEPVSANLALEGQLNRETGWQGMLSKGNIKTPVGNWVLNHPTRLGYNLKTAMANVEAHCWQQGQAGICLTQNLTAGKSGTADLAIKNINFEMLKPYLPDGIELKGGVGATASASWAPNQAPVVNAQVLLPEGSVNQRFSPDERPLIFAWDKVTLNADMKNDVLNANWLFAIKDNGDLSGQARITNLQGNQQINAQVKLDRFMLAFLEPVIKDYHKFDGAVNADLRVTGPILHPAVNGQLSVDKLQATGRKVPLDIKDAEITIDFNGYNAQLSGDIFTPDGKLLLRGMGDWQNMAAWKSELHVKGSELQVSVPPMVSLKVSPELSITANPKGADITGNVEIPWGRIRVNQLPKSAVSVSKDQVLLNNDLKPVKEQVSTPFDIRTNVMVKIGDDMKLKAFGLNAGLTGDLNVRQEGKGPMIYGEINITDGSFYRALGQELQIRKGQIIFNGPADQPYLAFEAIRDPDNIEDDVIAGVRVTGSADAPKVEIFSDPAMPQQNALSYILTGRNLDSEDADNGNAMTTALIGMGLAQSGQLVGDIGEAVGVKDLSLSTAGSGDDSQVQISGYIAPGLQVKYGVGIFNSIGEFTVRYRLMKDLYVEAVSGLDSAVDLLYQFEFN